MPALVFAATMLVVAHGLEKVGASAVAAAAVATTLVSLVLCALAVHGVLVAAMTPAHSDTVVQRLR